MESKRIVITGGPGSGKTSLILAMEHSGRKVMHEISREVTKRAQAEGIEQLFLTDPILFSQKLLKGRLEQFQNLEHSHQKIVFYDRGMPDVTSYLDYIHANYPAEFDEMCLKNRYDAVFILPPWKHIYSQDGERYETFEAAEKIFEYLLSGYKKYNYKVLEVPPGAVSQRQDFILTTLKSLY